MSNSFSKFKIIWRILFGSSITHCFLHCFSYIMLLTLCFFTLLIFLVGPLARFPWSRSLPDLLGGGFLFAASGQKEASVSFKLSSQSLLFMIRRVPLGSKFCNLAQITLRLGIKFLNSCSTCLSQEFLLEFQFAHEGWFGHPFDSTNCFWWMGSCLNLLIILVSSCKLPVVLNGFPGCKNVFSSVFKKLFDWSFFKKYKFLNNYKAVMYSKKEYKCWRLCYTS